MGMLLCQGVQKAQAKPLDLDAPCTINVSLGINVSYADLPSDLCYNLYKVAGATQIAGYDAYQFVANAEGTPFAKLDIASLNDRPTAAEYSAVSDAAAKIIANATTPIEPSLVSEDAYAPLADVPAGLYLLVAYSPDAVEDGKILTGPNEEGAYVSTAFSDSKVYTFSPQLIALPTKQADDNGVINTANPGDWITGTTAYPITITLKFDWEDRKGSINIHKLVSTFEQNNQGVGSNEVTFVFKIDGYKSRAEYYESQVPGSTIKPTYSNVVHMMFNAAGEQVLEVSDIPMSLYLVVTEIYTGASYEIVGNTNIDEGYPKDPMDDEYNKTDFYFENTPSNKVNNGGSVANSFNLGEDGWVWSKDGVVQDNDEGGDE